MLPTRYQLPAAAHVKPLKQGDLSNLCGLYSTLNALRLALWPQQLTKEQVRGLLGEGVAYLVRKRRLVSTIAHGMDESVWIELGRTLVTSANASFNSSLSLQPLFTGSRTNQTPAASTLTRTLRRAISIGQPVMCGIGGHLNHYTVLCGFSSTRIELFDSASFKWISPHSISSDGNFGTRHWIFIDSVRAVVDDW